MSKRTTRKELEGALNTLTTLLNKPKTGIGSWRLDHNSAYGGWKVVEIVNDGGAIHDIYTSARVSPSVLYEKLSFAIYILSRMGGKSPPA